jgi:glycosyltransferase involved in cell wall biosynthesis
VGELPRVLIVITLAEVGGAQTFVAHLLLALAQRYEVVVAAHGPGPLRAAAEAVGARYVPLRHVRRAVNPWRDVLGLAEMIVLCRRERPQVLHANSAKARLLGLLAARLTGVPVRLLTAHGWPFLWWSGLRGRLYLWGERLNGRLATGIVCVSEAERRAAVAAGVCSPEQAVVIHNAVDVSGTPRARHDGALPTMLSVGRLAEPKDFTTLVRALARLERETFRAWIVGDGPDREALESEIRRLGVDDCVELLGERDDVAGLMAQSDVFVLSSRSEGLPLSILEAMAAGLPVVGSEVGGVRELVADCGFVVPPGDPDALAAALRRLVADPELRRRRGELARRRAEARFDLRTFHRAYLDLYASELARLGGGAPYRSER